MLPPISVFALQTGENESITTDDSPASKSAEEYRIERLTWFGIVAVLVIIGVLPDWLTLHHGVTPLGAGLVIIVSGVVQRRRGWRIAFSTWLAGTLLLVIAGFNFVSRPDLDLSLAVIVVAVALITLGIFSRDH